LKSAAGQETKRKFLLGELLNLLARLYFMGFVHNNLTTKNIIVNSEEGLTRLYLAGSNAIEYHRRVSRVHWQQNFHQLTETLPDMPALNQDFSQLFAEARDKWLSMVSG
jgi:hypothetical protein